MPSGTFTPGSPTQVPYLGAGTINGVSGSALALVIAGGVALVSSLRPT